jgi:hypothetical protein
MDDLAISRLPWSATRAEFMAAARDVGDDAACCVFVINDEIPRTARSGYAQLIIAYARQNEPVTIDSDGTSALLIREGGIEAARIAAERIIAQMRRLALEGTIHAGVGLLGDDVDSAVNAAKAAALAGPAGEVCLSG